MRLAKKSSPLANDPQWTDIVLPFRRFAPLVAACLLPVLAGCDLGPAYRQPPLDIPAAYRATQESGRAAWPARDWWKGFGSPELDQLIADAQNYNFDIQAAIARVRQADAQVRISGAPLLPTVDANGQQSWQRSGARGRGATSLDGVSLGGSSKLYVETRSYNANLSVSYEVDLWGRIRAQQESAEASALFSRFDQETVALTAVTSVATTWFQALAYQDRLDVLHRNLHDFRIFSRPSADGSKPEPPRNSTWPSRVRSSPACKRRSRPCVAASSSSSSGSAF